MSYKNKLRQSEIGIARHLIPANVEKQEFWNEHWPVIETLSTLEAVLDERIYFFQSKPHQREGAISLIAIADMAWQQIRILAGVKGKDSTWFQSYLPQDYSDLQKAGFDSYDLDIDIANGLIWLFDLHSAIRHPNKKNIKKHPFLLYDPWPKKEANRLFQVTSSLLRILYVFSDEFDESGWENDIQKKGRLRKQQRQ